jgi:hypothetical protein
MKIYPPAGDDKGEPNVKFHSMRSSIAAISALFAAILLSSCGGGGAGGNPNQGGAISVSPQIGTFYAGVPSRMTLSGGRKPYSMTSSEPGILDVPAIVDANFVDVIPNNPGVVDADLQPGELPSRTVTISIRDTTGILVTATIHVARNFLTGYGISLTPTTCPSSAAGAGATATTTVVSACVGGTTALRMSAIFNGSLNGNRQFRFQAITPNFTITNPATNVTGTTIVLNSDHDGILLGLINVPNGTSPGIAILRVTDVVTGVYADEVFVISAAVVTPAAPLDVIPSTLSFTGASATRCGIGSGDVLVFDGKTPYTATSTDASVLVTPATSNTQPGKFTITVVKENPPCITAASVVIVDANGTRATVTVNSALGTQTTPPLAVSPSAITLACGATGSVSIVGGSGSYSVNSSNQNVSAFAAGNTLSINRALHDIPASGGVVGGTSTVSVTDGATIVNVTVTSPPSCP